MKTRELINHLRTVYLDDASVQVSGPDDALAGADTTVSLFDAAAREFARRTWCLADEGNPSVGVIPLSGHLGERSVPYSPRILRVRAVRYSDSDFPLLLSSRAYVRPSPMVPRVEPGYWDVNAQYVINPGRASRYALDGATRTIQFDRPIDAETAALSLILDVVRLPVAALTLDSEPEIPSQYHEDLCLFVAGRLLSGPNHDAGVRTVGREYLREWEALVRRAREETRASTNGVGGFLFGAWAGDDSTK